MKLTCSACRPVLKGILQYFTDTKYFFKTEFKTENYYKHFYYTLAIMLPITAILLFIFDLNDTPLLYQMFISGFIGFGGNWIRENKKMNAQKGVPFSIEDVHFGSYAGVLCPLIIKLIILLVNLIL